MITLRQVCVVAAFAAAGLSSSLSAFAHGGGSSTVGVPNPASKYCVDNGGELVSVNGSSFAFCKIGDALVEEWTLFRATHGSGQIGTDIFLGDGTLSCTDAGGMDLIAVKDADSSYIAYCEFGDNSAIEDATLQANSSDGDYQGMKDLLSGVTPAPASVDLDAASAAWLFAKLAAAHAPRDPVVGATTYHVETLACGRIIVPGMPVTCSLDFPALAGQPARTVTWTGAKASHLFDVVDAAVGRSDAPGVLGGAHVKAKAIECSIVIVPGATPRCSLFKGI